jgi:hypothetical protein
MPFTVKKMDTSFSDFSNKPQPTTSALPFHLGLIVQFSHLKGSSFLESQQLS